MKEAYRYLKAADGISPDNLGRICTLGELELQARQGNKALETFERGVKLDPLSAKAQAGKVVAKNLQDYLAQKPPTISKTFACLMNSIGISKVQGGDIEDGITHYKSALSFLGDPDNKTKVMFNIGYGYLREGDYEAAVHWFDQSYSESSNSFEKALKYSRLLKTKLITSDEEVICLKDEDDDLDEGQYSECLNNLDEAFGS